MVCPHVTPDAARWAPVACDHCCAYVDRDRTLMSAAVARARYPECAALIDAVELHYHPPAPPPPTTAQAVGRTAGIVGRLAVNTILLILALPVLAALIVTFLALAT